MAKVKITVLKRGLEEDLIRDYSADPNLARCETYHEGQVFYASSVSKMPEGFCGFAWSDINKDVMAILHGANIPWVKEKGKMITCCTDGFRPVYFLIEKVE